MPFAPVAAITLAAALALTPRADVHVGAHALTLAHRLEVGRIQAHFDSVLAVLPHAARADLTPGQRVRRQALLAMLKSYRDAGVFPHNRDFGQQPVPYFIDRETGTHCAVAHLMASTGRRDIAERVAAMDNNIYVAELAGDTAFTRWLAAHGLTLTEAAWIQVPYIDDGGAQVSPARTSYGTVSLGSSGAAATLALVNAFTNRDGHGRARTWLGLALGTASLGVAAIGATSDAPTGFVAGNLAAGAVGVLTSANGFLTQRRLAAAEATRGEGRVAASVMPILPAEGRGAGAGVSFEVKF